MRLRHRMREEAAHRAVAVRDRELALGAEAGLHGVPGGLDQAVVERVLERRRLRLDAAPRAAGLGLVQDRREVDAALAPLRKCVVDLEEIDAADEILEPGDAELRHQPSGFFGDEEEEVDHVLRLACELRAQLGILGRDPDRAGVQMAGAHHHAAGRDQRRGGEAHLVGAQ